MRSGASRVRETSPKPYAPGSSRWAAWTRGFRRASRRPSIEHGAITALLDTNVVSELLRPSPDRAEEGWVSERPVAEYPARAVREAITNAVMHRDWFFEGANVFVEIYTDRIEVSSPGGLPKGLTLTDLGHKSIRRNPLISDLLHRIGFIEKAGTGIRRIRDEARELDCPEPEFEAGSFVTVTFRPNPEVREEVTGEVTPEVTGEVTPEVTPEVRLLEAMSGDMTRHHLQVALGLSDDEHFRKAWLLPALQAGLIEMTIPDKPRSRKQRYRLTAAGREYLKQIHEAR